MTFFNLACYHNLLSDSSPASPVSNSTELEVLGDFDKAVSRIPIIDLLWGRDGLPGGDGKDGEQGPRGERGMQGTPRAKECGDHLHKVGQWLLPLYSWNWASLVLKILHANNLTTNWNQYLSYTTTLTSSTPTFLGCLMENINSNCNTSIIKA